MRGKNAVILRDHAGKLNTLVGGGIASRHVNKAKGKAQRARLVKWGMDAEKVAKMGTEDVRVLVQRPAVVKKLVAKAAK